jgi:hypothetical protein
MAQVNAAYDLLRAGGARPAPSARPPAEPVKGRGSWLSRAVQRALGAELLEALEPGEEVRLVTPTATWASARAVLVVTDRRLLWLLDDAPVARVRSLPLRDVGRVEQRSRRKRASVTVHTLSGRRYAFHELRPHTADTIERHLTPARPA